MSMNSSNLSVAFLRLFTPISPKPRNQAKSSLQATHQAELDELKVQVNHWHAKFNSLKDEVASTRKRMLALADLSVVSSRLLEDDPVNQHVCYPRYHLQVSATQYSSFPPGICIQKAVADMGRIKAQGYRSDVETGGTYYLTDEEEEDDSDFLPGHSAETASQPTVSARRKRKRVSTLLSLRWPDVLADASLELDISTCR